MIRIGVVVGVFLISSLSLDAQTAQPIAPPPPPQTPRQALLEMFLGTAPDHLEKHLPEIAKKPFQRLQAGGNVNFVTEIGAMGAQANATKGLQVMETGPILLAMQEPGSNEKFDVVVEQDNLVGDEDEIDLTFQMYKNGKLQPLPVLPRLTFMMKMESRVWRLNEISFLARVPIGDPEFLQNVVKNLQEDQQRRNEMVAGFSIRTIVNGESTYRSLHPERGFTCSLSELSHGVSEGGLTGPPIDEQLASGKKEGYVFALTGCDASHYKVAAEPALSDSGQRAFCADESGVVKFAKNGKATTCLSNGEVMSEAPSFYTPD